jgi:hypothetical protein
MYPMSATVETPIPRPAVATLPRNPLEWLKFFGPGAILASLTIGVGELVFSTRAGALFGYKLLWFFALILFFKWVLVYSTARHMALTGAHPFQRWMEVPGPRGWLPILFLLLAVGSFPIWVAFHSGTLGTLVGALMNSPGGSSHFAWGIALLFTTLLLTSAGGYKALERAQIFIVAIMLLSVVAAVFFLKPDWGQFFVGLFVPQPVAYPSWAKEIPELSTRPVWIETITYVGIIGGSGYDYLAYVSYLREKGWGQANLGIASEGDLREIAANQNHPHRQWLRPILFDSIFSFLAVLIFTAVFTACGAIILGPQKQIPAGTNLLMLQSQFLTPLSPGLRYIYFTGAFLAVFGTLYGTIEVAPAIAREICFALNPALARARDQLIRKAAILWVSLGAFAVLIISLAKKGSPPTLIKIVTPANLITGVFACGLIFLFSVWADRRLPKGVQMPIALKVLNLLGGVIFMGLGIRSFFY